MWLRPTSRAKILQHARRSVHSMDGQEERHPTRCLTPALAATAEVQQCDRLHARECRKSSSSRETTVSSGIVGSVARRFGKKILPRIAVGQSHVSAGSRRSVLGQPSSASMRQGYVFRGGKVFLSGTAVVPGSMRLPRWLRGPPRRHAHERTGKLVAARGRHAEPQSWPVGIRPRSMTSGITAKITSNARKTEPETGSRLAT